MGEVKQELTRTPPGADVARENAGGSSVPLSTCHPSQAKTYHLALILNTFPNPFSQLPILFYFYRHTMLRTSTSIPPGSGFSAYGLPTATSWARTHTAAHRFLYNGPTETNPTTGWGETYFRTYDPVLARFHQVDPLAAKYASLSPYNYAFNNPVSLNDPTGAEPPQTIRHTATNSTWYTSYTYDDRVDHHRWDGAQYIYNNMSRVYNRVNINWAPAGISWSAIMRGLALTLSSSHGGIVNIETGRVSYFDERGSMIAGAMHMMQHGTMTASIASALRNYFTPVYASAGATDVPEYFEGVMIIDSTIGDLKYGAAFTLPGVGIFLSKDFWAEKSAKSLRDLLKHEYGHILQAEKWGKEFFYQIVSPISLNSAKKYGADHKYTWTERTANYFSREYFINESWNYFEFPIYYPTHQVKNKSLTIPPFGIPLKLPVWWDIPDSLNRG
jgi:RHS repeat-associated protein